MTKLTRRRLFAGGGYVAASALGATLLTTMPAWAEDVDFGGEELLVQTYGGTLATYFRDEFAATFNERYNANVMVEEGLSTDTVAKLRTSGGQPHVDVFMVTIPWASVLEAENLTEPLTVEAVPNLLAIEQGNRSAKDAYVTAFNTSMTIAYNTNVTGPDKLPKTWAELADPKFKDKFTLPVPGNAHAVMLMARLANPEGSVVEDIEPAFVTLKTIAPNVQTYWTSFDQAFGLLNSGQSEFSIQSTDRTIDQVFKGAPVATYFPAEGTTIMSNTIGIAKGTAQPKLAAAWVDFILSAEVQEHIGNKLGFKPVRDDITLSAEVSALLPSGEALANSLVPDWADISNKQADWIDRYTREIVSQ